MPLLLPQEVLELILEKLNSLAEVANLARTCKQLHYRVTPFLYYHVVLNVNGPSDRTKAIYLAKLFCQTSRNHGFIEKFSVLGYWRHPEEFRISERRENGDITSLERRFGEHIVKALLVMPYLREFRWRVIAYLPTDFGTSLLGHGKLQAFEAFADPQIQSLRDIQETPSGLTSICFPASIVPVGMHSLRSLHILQLGTFRDCACYGDIIQASPNLKSLWVDISPNFAKTIDFLETDACDILPLLLRQQGIDGNRNKSVKLRLRDLRMGRLNITLAGVLALRDCVDLDYLETLVLYLCHHEEFIPFVTRRTPNLTCFREDEDGDLLYVEEFLRYNAAAMLVQEDGVTLSSRHKEPLRELWISCSMTKVDGMCKLSKYFTVCGERLTKLCLDMNWGEFCNPGEILQGCPILLELGAWIECEGDQWEAMATAIATHSTLRDLCIFNSSPKGSPLNSTTKSRLYSCAKSNRLGHGFYHREFNEDGDNVGYYQTASHGRKGGNLQHIGIRHDERDKGLLLSLWRVMVDYEEQVVSLSRMELINMEGTTLYNEVMQTEYFYPTCSRKLTGH